MKKIIYTTLLGILGFSCYQFCMADTEDQKVYVNNTPSININNTDAVAKPIVTPDPTLIDNLNSTISNTTWINTLTKAYKDTAQALQTSVLSTITFDLSENVTKASNINDLSNQNTTETSTKSVLESYFNKGSTFNPIDFGGTSSSNQSSSLSINNNNILNAEAFLNPPDLVYANTTPAQLYIRYLTSLSNLWVPVLGQSFTIANGPDGSSDYTITLPSNYSVSQLQSDLQKNPMYRSYRTNYRAQIAMRSLFLGTILDSYQKRVPNANGTSIAQIEKAEATRRLSNAYYNAMKNAKAPTIQFETLMALAEIRKSLYDIERHQERLEVLNAVNGLLNLNTAMNSLNQQAASSISKLIYCTIPSSSYSGSAYCQNQTGPGGAQPH